MSIVQVDLYSTFHLMYLYSGILATKRLQNLRYTETLPALTFL